MHFIKFTKEKLISQHDKMPDSEKTDIIRSVFERASQNLTLEFKGEKFWDSYVSWETDVKNPRNVFNILDQLIGIPTSQHLHFFNKLKEVVKKNAPETFLSPEEFTKLKAEYDVEQGLKDDSEDNDKVKETAFIVEKLLAEREQKYKDTAAEVAKRQQYEEAIKRPYFHVKPLEKVQLKNWRDYLDFEIAQGKPDRIKYLFERCLIACALYDEFWQKYASYIDGECGEAAAREVYTRACRVHLSRQPTLHYVWAEYEETHGNQPGALSVLSSLSETLPSLVAAHVRHAQLLVRSGHPPDEITSLYRSWMAEASTSDVASFYAIKLSRYLLKVVGDKALAIEVLNEALEKNKSSARLHVQLLDTHFHTSVPVDEVTMCGAFQQAIYCDDLSLQDRLMFCERYIEFLHDFGTNVKKIAEARDKMTELTKEKEVADKKRGAPSGSASGEPTAKKSRPEEQSSTSSGQQSAPYSAGQQPPAGGANYDYSQYYQNYYQQDPNASYYNQYQQYYGQNQ